MTAKSVIAKQRGAYRTKKVIAEEQRKAVEKDVFEGESDYPF